MAMEDILIAKISEEQLSSRLTLSYPRYDPLNNKMNGDKELVKNKEIHEARKKSSKDVRSRQNA
jgi:hypothetical protein